MYEILPKFFKNMRNSHTSIGARQELANKTLQHFWPSHKVLFINSSLTYDNIDSIFPAFTKKQDIIILQTEEDFLKTYDVTLLRNIIKSFPQWTSNSFLITNSLADYRISKEIINTIFRPGILDLICYLPYEDTINFDSVQKIKYHTAFYYRRRDPARTEIAKLLLNYKETIFSIVYDNKFVIPNNMQSNNIISKHDTLDSPFLNIEKDQGWSDQSIFHIIVEPLNVFSTDPKLYSYAPILSEKTFRAIHLKRPALIYSGPGTRDMLQKLGFDTWDWLIDWSFDKPDCEKEGFNLFLKELERLLNLDIDYLKDLLLTNQNKLEHNKTNLIRLINNYNQSADFSNFE
jgi:hypothetical protein